MTKPDIASTNHGTIIVIRPVSDRGRRWLHRHVCADSPVVGGSLDQLECEHRCGLDILLAALGAGLKLRDETSGRVTDKTSAEYKRYSRDVIDPRD